MDYRIKYLIRSAFTYFEKQKCPNCGSTDLIKVQRKYAVTLLLKCRKCGLNHRHPKDSKKWLEKFYQREYKIDTHMMTHMPNDPELEQLIANNFPDQRDYSRYFDIFFKNRRDVKVVDYGCSWGYDVLKLKHSGFDAVGYEISKPRAEFGREKLGLDIVDNENELREQNDIIFSSHVIEHLYSVPDFVRLSGTKLKKGGYFIAFCPNGNLKYREREPEIFRANWGSVHPFYLDYEFVSKLFANNPFLLLTGDWEYNTQEIAKWDCKSQSMGEYKEGKELLIIARPNIYL